ncbi:MAG: ribosome maturation factor RimM [Synergistaceae bacterium]|jgi:16S rRNA processing protein RimM|nr:ribosome maturation factor RimM [Synergistaceae bacterium]
MSTSSKNDGTDRELLTRKISIGYISAAHGVRGEIRIVPLTDYPERFSHMDSLKLYSPEGAFVRALRIRNIRGDAGRGELIVEGDPTDRDEAKALVGLSIMIDPEERAPLTKGEFWVDDLIGLQVRDGEGHALGRVSDFFATGGSELYEVRDEDGALHYIPAVAEFVKDIDLSSGTITVELIEGLW